MVDGSGQWGQPPPQRIDAGRITAGSPRSYAGFAALAAGAVLVFSGSPPWGIASVPDGAHAARFSLNGFGELSYEPSFGESNPDAELLANVLNRAGVLESPGAGAAVLGGLGVLAAVAYLKSQKRSMAAVIIAGAGLVATILALTQLANIRGMFSGVSDLADSDFAPGPGGFTAVLAALALAALGICAFALEKVFVARLARSAPLMAANQSTTPLSGAPSMSIGPAAAANRPIPGAPAEMGPRAAAAGIDIVIVSLIAGMITSIASTIVHTATTAPARTVLALLTVLLVTPIPLAYFALSEARTGRTLGKLVMGIEVQGPTGFAPTLRESLRRNVAQLLLGASIALMGAIRLERHLLFLCYLALVLCYLGWLVRISVTAFSDPVGNPWRLGLHDRFAHGPTRVLNRTEAPLARSSTAPLTPWWAAAVVVLLLMGVTSVADSVIRSTNRRDSASGTPTVTPTTTVTVQAPAPTRNQQPSTVPRIPRPHRASWLPAGASLCPPRYGSAGAFTESAIGNDHTSCEFAEEVRIAYADTGQPGSVQHLTVTSPVTGQSYTMSCGPAAAGFIVCRGGNDAFVYLN